MNEADALMAIFGLSRATCKTCRYAEGRLIPHGWVLHCQKHNKTAEQPCLDYMREPGSDDE